jgi:hypothetical protein
MGGLRMRSSVAAAAALPLLLLSACTQVIETTPFDVTAYGPEPACHSSLGAYFLPRALIHFTASKDGTATSGTLDTNLNLVPDRAQPLCLDYLSLPTAQDIITVQRDQSTGLLTSISSDAVDRTPQIVNALVATGANIAIASARSGQTTTTLTTDTLDIEFDPFIYVEMAAAKKAMRRFGFCLYVEGHSLPTGFDPREASADAQRWCSIDGLPPYQAPALEFAALPLAPDAMGKGVLYRPAMPMKLVILRKKDPDGPGPWTLFQVRRVEMPNISPVLAIGVKRAMFTERQTTLSFNKGILTDVAVNKKSELAGFVQIPLAVAQAVVSVPGQILTVRLTDTNNQTALLGAQAQLIQAVATYQQTVANNPLPSARRGTLDARSGQLIGGCLDAHGPAEVCKTLPAGLGR